jgi:Rad3-related DNA helicase
LGPRAQRSRIARAVAPDAAARLRFIAAADPAEGLRWFDFSAGTVAVHWTPLDIGAALAARIEAQSGVWVFASATLAVGIDFLALPAPHRRRGADHERAAESVRLRAQRADLCSAGAARIRPTTATSST